MCVPLMSNCGKGTDVEALRSTMEMLLDYSFRPSRTVMFAFGFDEEIGGYNVVIFLGPHTHPEAVLMRRFTILGSTTHRGVTFGYIWPR